VEIHDALGSEPPEVLLNDIITFRGAALFRET